MMLAITYYQMLPEVILDSPITAACAGRFGQDILVGTAAGELCNVSWLGEVNHTLV
jgi:hypothetical protein